MPGAITRYEHLGARFLNECDTGPPLVAGPCRITAPGLDG